VALANADDPEDLQSIERPESFVAEIFVDLVSSPKTLTRQQARGRKRVGFLLNL
jgi:hypothetical protein